MLERELQEIGLNEKEAKTYLASLELGQSTVQEIAKKSGINRATTYFIIETLMTNGLMSSFHKGKKQYFIAADPERLVEILEKQKENISKKQENAKKLLPQLQSINNKKTNRPVVRYFEGKEGIAAMVDEFLKTKKTTITMAYSVDAIQKIFSKEERKKWVEKRLDRKIETKVIYTSKEGEISTLPSSKRRMVPFDKFPITCDIAIYDNKIRIASLGNTLGGIVIEEKEIAKSLKAILDLAWEAAKKYEK